MLIRKVSKMGEKVRVVYLPPTDFSWNQRVRLKPRGLDYYVVKNVSKMGLHLVVIIPKADWSYFRHRSEVYITEVKQ